ncbi:hypothetical protein ABBQ38_001831 [Trebouxia sp. C0009 RCD-2024]
MPWAKLLEPITSSGKRIAFLRPYRLSKAGAHQGGQMTSDTPCTGVVLSDDRKQLQSLTPDIVSLHTYQLHTRWLQLETLAVSTAGHPQFHSTAQAVSQSHNKLPTSPDISMLSPELQQQWHVDSNMHLGAIKVKPCSTIRAVWKCSKCPVGQPHVWTTSVINRRPSSTCPYCSKRRLCLHNSLATIAPDVAQYWDVTKNEKSPEQVLAGSRSKAEWKCPACKYEWKATIQGRVRKSSGCPKCSQASRVMHSQPTFAEAQPAVLAEWDHERNEAEGFYPHLVTLGSDKQVHWICSCCPAGQLHRWTAMPVNRVRNGTGCAVCAGKQTCVCNSLESLFPSIAVQFDMHKK